MRSITSMNVQLFEVSGAKLQTALDELDVLKSSTDTTYKVRLSAALSPLSSRLRRCKANIEIRIAEMKDYLTSNIAHTATEQKELCDTADESSVTVASADNDDDIVQIDESSMSVQIATVGSPVKRILITLMICLLH